MGAIYHLDVGCADASVIKTTTATFLIDCHDIEQHAHLLPSDKHLRGVFVTQIRCSCGRWARGTRPRGVWGCLDRVRWPLLPGRSLRPALEPGPMFRQTPHRGLGEEHFREFGAASAAA